MWDGDDEEEEDSKAGSPRQPSATANTITNPTPVTTPVTAEAGFLLPDSATLEMTSSTDIIYEDPLNIEDRTEDEEEFDFTRDTENYAADEIQQQFWDQVGNPPTVEYPGEDGLEKRLRGLGSGSGSSIASENKDDYYNRQKITDFGRKSDVSPTDDFFNAYDENIGEWMGENDGWRSKAGVPYMEFAGEGDEDVQNSNEDWQEQWTNDQAVIEEEVEEVEEIPVRKTSEQEFLETVMTISETEAVDRMDNLLAQQIGPDTKLRYVDEKGAIPPVADISSITISTEPRMHQCPSIESFFKKPHSVDCQFYYTIDGKIYTKDCRLDVTVWQLKKQISKFVKVPPDNLDFRRSRNLVADKKTLLELGGRAKKKMKFTVEINKRVPGNYELWNPKRHIVKVKPEVRRKVKIENDAGPSYEVLLSINYDLQKMRYMGGYYDRRKKIKFLHATTQTLFVDDGHNELAKNTACQTLCNQSVSQQTPLDKGQQMQRDDFYVPNKDDKVLFAKDYLSFEWWEKKRGKAVIVIQRYWRRWLAIKERKRRMDGLIARIEWAECVRKGRTDQRLAIIDDEMKRQHNPTRLLDMELLYRAINAWRKEEEAFVKENRWGAERRAALATLTEMEADLLLDLEKTKNKIKVTQKDDFINSVFTKMGKPKRWLGSKTNNFINMDSTDKLRVRQLHNLYKELQLPPESKEQRLELLEKLTLMIKHYSSNMCKYLMSLINREIAMMNRQVSKRLLGGVRLRIANGLYHLCQDPNFNSESKMLQKIPWDEQKLRKDMVQCKGCRRMQYRDEFTIVRGTSVTTRCHNCMNLYRTAILRVDLNLYRHMLKELRRDELQAGITNSVALLIDAFDIQFLVEQIWHGQSALSGIDNRYLLRLCRWNRDLPWMPWNCVLLTEEEAVAHMQLDDMHDAYRETFFHKVSITQSAARTYYERLSKLSLNLDERVKETCEVINKQNIWKTKRKAQLKQKLKQTYIHEKHPNQN